MSDLKNRYARQIVIEGFGIDGQKRISEGKVLIIGCGALGSMVAMQLAGAGVGVLGLADFDTIDISNLQRQFFYTTAQAGLPKIEMLSEKIKALNPNIKIIKYPEIITLSKAEKIFQHYDFIIDATDNPESKKMIGDISSKYNKPYSIAGVRDFSGQVMTVLPGSDRLEDYFGSATMEGFLPCSIGGVMGPAAVLCASIQASEALKYLAKIGTPLINQLLCFNLKNNSFHIYK